MSFEVCVRGIIIKGGEILVCKNKNKNYYYFPGGHVELGETAEYALRRELKEELNLKIKGMTYIGANENLFKDGEGEHHEINLIFEVKADSVEDKSFEDHIDFFFLNKESLDKEDVRPKAIKKGVLQWMNDEKPFWSSRA